MKQVIAVLDPKGGSGKTTLATNLAGAALKAGRMPIILDTDQQASARKWRERNPDGPILVFGQDRPKSLEADVKGIKHDDIIIIDGASKADENTAYGVRAADIVLIPVRLTVKDAEAVEGLVDAIKTRQALTDGRPKAAFVYSCVKQDMRVAREQAEKVKEYGLPVLNTAVPDREIFIRADAQGKTVHEVAKYHDAIRAMDAIWNEVSAMLR